MREKVKQIILKHALTENYRSGNTRLKEDLGIDSLRLVELVVELEDAFVILFSENDLSPDNLKTVDDIYQLAEGAVVK
jgi:acyl carrier protein